MFISVIVQLCAIHFHNVDKDIYFAHSSLHSYKDDRNFTHNYCPVAKHEGSCVLDQT